MDNYHYGFTIGALTGFLAGGWFFMLLRYVIRAILNRSGMV